MITHIIIEAYCDNGLKQHARLIKIKDPVPTNKIGREHLKSFYIKVDGIDGRTEVIFEEQLCVLCKGTGGIRYHYEQDHSVSVKCPVCNDGNQEEWNQAKADWEKRCS